MGHQSVVPYGFNHEVYEQFLDLCGEVAKCRGGRAKGHIGIPHWHMEWWCICWMVMKTKGM